MNKKQALRFITLLVIFIGSAASSAYSENSKFDPTMRAIDKFSCYVKFHGNKRHGSYTSRFDKFVERKMQQNENGHYYYKGYFTKTLNLRTRNGFFGVGKLGYEFFINTGSENPVPYFRICTSGSFEYKGEKVIKNCRKENSTNDPQDDIQSLLSQKWVKTKFLSGQPLFNPSILRPVSVFSKHRYTEPVFSFHCRYVSTTIRP